MDYEKLDSFIEGRLGAPFVWGANDCALFAADAMLALHGVDFAKAYRGKYNTEKAAQRLIKRAGGLSAIVDKAGLDYVEHPAVGDVVLVGHEDGESLGVCVGAHVYSVGKAGLVRLPLNSVLRAWRVNV